MAIQVQVTFDCADPARLARFWAEALHYRSEAPPAGFDDWPAFLRSIGVPEEELNDGDSVVDPDGAGPRLYFQQVPEGKTLKNRLHLDLAVGGGRSVPLATRRARVEAEADRLVAAGATRLRVNAPPGMDQYGVVMSDPEGNEFCLH
ncbi:VOC family protein [Rugosimonospora acidiphila]